MKELLANIWNGKAATLAGAICAAIGVAVGADLDWPEWVIVGLSSVGAFLGAIAGPTKPTK